jgi:cytochrome bd-type quinol oxidase subunit 2
MQNLKNKLLVFTTSIFVVFSLSPAMVLADARSQIQCGANNAAGVDCNAQTNPETDVNSTIKNVINLLSVLVGVVAVIMLILGGFRYITSGGTAEKVSNAKNTLVYAIVGLVIVALAQVIVRFVLTNVTNSQKKSGLSHSQITYLP